MLKAWLEACREANDSNGQTAAGEPAARGDLPLLDDVEIDALPLPVLTLLLAALDAFNPCAFFVLLVLLSLMVHSGSRARMLLVGGTFVRGALLPVHGRLAEPVPGARQPALRHARRGCGGAAVRPGQHPRRATR
jgi:hypothetical protein